MKKDYCLVVLVALIGLAAGAAASCATSQVSLGGAAKNDVWLDSESGLIWQVSPGGPSNWAAAKEYCKGLSWGGHKDWRLPTISELRSLIRGCAVTQKGGACGVTDSCLASSCQDDYNCRRACRMSMGPGANGAYWPPEIDGARDWYWSSSAVNDAPRPGDGPYAWYVDFDKGEVHFDDVGNSRVYEHGYYARCVRSSAEREKR